MDVLFSRVKEKKDGISSQVGSESMVWFSLLVAFALCVLWYFRHGEFNTVRSISSIDIQSSRSEEQKNETGFSSDPFQDSKDPAERGISCIQKDIRLEEKETKRSEDGWNEFTVSGNCNNSVSSAVALGLPEDILTGPENIYKECGPLDEGDIRILFLHPAKDENDLLVCSLQIESLNKTPKPEYAALSYCWGFDHSSTELYILPSGVEVDMLQLGSREVLKSLQSEGNTLRIGENLKRALLRLRSNEKCIALWVDAICINQKNSEEKTQQLRQMAQVYLKADFVCVWLGEADEDGKSDRAMDFIPEIMDFMNQEPLFNDEKNAENWHALAELMRNRWFSRRWVVQEISLAAAAFVYCGTKTVQWDDFAIAVSTLVGARDEIKNLFGVRACTEGPRILGEVQTFGANVLIRAIERLFMKDAKGDIIRPVIGIESLVTSLSTFDTTNPRDIVYSLAAIASDTYNPSSYGKHSRVNEDTEVCNLIIDYANLSEVDFYKHFVHFCIESSKSLDIICRPWAMPPRTGGFELPSWVRLLRDSAFGEPCEVYNGRKNGDSLVGPVDHPRYNASGGRKCRLPLGNDRLQDIASEDQPPALTEKQKTTTGVLDFTFLSTIWAKGFKLARIQKLSSAITSGLIKRHSLQDICWAGVDNGQHIMSDHLWSTLIANRDSKGQKPPPWYQKICSHYLGLAESSNNGEINIDQFLQESGDMSQEYLTRARDVTFNRRLFRATTNLSQAQQVTENKNPASQETDSDDDLFGLCPEGAVQGDLICILYGCSVPVLLRDSDPEKNTFKVIGETYAHGKMEGEAMEEYIEREQSFGLV